MEIILQRILSLLKENNITATKFQQDLGLYASCVSEWKNGSSKSYTKHLAAIADYLGVTTDYLIGNTDQRTATPGQVLEGLDFALSGEIRNMTENEKQDLLDYIQFKRSQKEKRNP